jgi:hypothetical protein
VFNAGALAINDDAPRIEIEHLRQAYDEQKPPGITFNAFVDDISKAPDLEGDKGAALKLLNTNQLMSKKSRNNA